MWRVAVVGALLTVILIGVPLVVVGYPDPAFPYVKRHANLILRSDAPIDADTAAALIDVEARLEALEINDRSIEHRLFLCTRAERYRFFARLLGVTPSLQGVNAPLVNAIFLSQSFLETMRERFGGRFRYSLVEGDFAHVATHEIVHTLISKRMGFVAARRLPAWKREGYAEYGAVAAATQSDQSGDLSRRFARYEALSREAPGPARMEYLRAQLLVEYLISVEGLDFESVLRVGLSDNEVFERLVEHVRRDDGAVGIHQGP